MATVLPEDLVLFKILTKLPVKSLMRFKCVSKFWKTCISSNGSFIDIHLRQQRQSEDIPKAIILYNKNIDDKEDEGLMVEDEQVGLQVVNVFSRQFSKVSEFDVSYVVAENGPIKFVGSCKGLVCLTCDEFPERVLLWNPATRQLRQLPCLSNVSDLWSVGFGLDDVSGDWKVVCLFLEWDNKFPFESPVRVHVFSKSDTVWRDCRVSGIKGYPSEEETPIAAAGALHWTFSTEQSYSIMSFDLNNELFRFVHQPNCEYFNICEWRSLLAALTFGYDHDDNVMAGYVSVASPSAFGEGLKWSKLVKFTLKEECNLRVFVWREQLLMSHNGHGFFVLSLVDPQARDEATNLKQLRFDAPYDGSLAFHDYVPTIIPVF